jgi:ketosteroid isomerase-like protein
VLDERDRSRPRRGSVAGTLDPGPQSCRSRALTTGAPRRSIGGFLSEQFSSRTLPPPGDTAWAMSEENVALARKAIDALNRGDLDALLAFLSPDVVWEALEGVPGIGELYRGRAGVREWIELMWENAQEGVHIEIEQITDLADDRVFIAVVLTARRRGSGVPFEYRTWQIVRFADGLITRRQVFWTRAEALKTAGLRE